MGVGRWARGRGGTRGGAPGSPAEPGLAPSALGLATVCRSHEQLLVPVSVRLTAAAAGARRTGVGRGEREREREESPAGPLGSPAVGVASWSHLAGGDPELRDAQ